MSQNPDQIGRVQKNSDIFFGRFLFMSSTGIRRLEDLEEVNKNATIFCFSESINKFLLCKTFIPANRSTTKS